MKKIFLTIIIIVGFIFINNFSFAQDSKTESPSSKIDKNALYEKFILTPFKNATASIDEFRLTLAKEFQKKVDTYKAKKDQILNNSENIGKKVEEAIKEDNLKNTQNYVSSDAGNPISLTWVTILFYIFTFLAYTFATAYIFYLLFGLIVFLVFRFIWTYLL